MCKWIAALSLVFVSSGAYATPPEWISHFVGQMNTAALTCELESNLSAQADSQALIVAYKTRGRAAAATVKRDPADNCESRTAQAADGFNAAAQASGASASLVKSAYAAWLTYMDTIGSPSATAEAQAKMAYRQAVNELYAEFGDQ